jgi:hypothetical protein
MSLDTNMTMVEALRLTRAGRLTEASEILQRRLASAGTDAADESTVAQPFGDLGHLRKLMPNSRPEDAPLGLNHGAIGTEHGALDRDRAFASDSPSRADVSAQTPPRIKGRSLFDEARTPRRNRRRQGCNRASVAAGLA